MRRPAFTFGVLSTAALTLACACLPHEAHAQEPGCRTGATAAAGAYVLSNPIYAYYFGNFEQYVANNASHFRQGSDAVRCLQALSRNFLQTAVQLYDPTEQTRRAELNAQLGAMGISPGPQESTPSSEMFAASLRLSRLARTLPAAANGDFRPYRTPTTELEQMQAFAEQLLPALLADPGMREILAMMEPMVKELANIEYEAILRQAAALAGPGESDSGDVTRR